MDTALLHLMAVNSHAVSGFNFMPEKTAKVSHIAFTSSDSFINFPMDEISHSVCSGEINIPTHLQTVDEIDEWIMNL